MRADLGCAEKLVNTSSLRSAIPSSSSHDLPADCGNQGLRNRAAGVAHIVALDAQHASGSVCLFRLTAVVYFAGAYAVYRLDRP